MNNKIIVFLCILSLLVPFIPSFDLCVSAGNSVSVDLTDPDYVRWLYNETGLYIDLDDTSNPLYPYKLGAPFSQQVSWFLSDYGYVVKNPVNAVIDSLQSITDIQILEQQGREELYNFAVENNYPSISQNIVNTTLNYAKDNLTYYIYDFININDFFSYYNFSNYSFVNSNLSTFKAALESHCSDSNFVYFLSSKSRSGMNYLYDSTFVKIPRSFFDSGYLVLSSGSFSDIVNYRYQSFRVPSDGSSIPSTVNLNGFLSLYDGLSFVSSLEDMEIYDVTSKNGGNNFDNFNYFFGNLSSDPFRIGLIQNSQGWFSNQSFFGTAFIYSGESFSVPVFRSTNLISDFLSGNAPVYKFNKEIDLGQFGADIDYTKLYDLISTTVQGNSGNVIDSINYVANNYLQQQLDLLHDINNALNDGNGQSWLRRIYGILDYNFPLTLNAFNDLIDAVENISVSGVGGDFSEATQVLHDIDSKLGILIEEPFIDLSDAAWNSMKSRVQTKFPFCIFSDIVAISVILNRPPQQPDLNFPVPIMGSESENIVHIDLSPYEHARPYVHGALIFVFILGLLALSVKIFDHLKS